MTEHTKLENPFKNSNNNTISNNFISIYIFYNYLASINPNVLLLLDNLPKCPICLNYLKDPVKPIGCNHIFCEICLLMWLQKKNQCPICRNYIPETTQIYLPYSDEAKNKKLELLNYEIEQVKLDNFGKVSKICIVCGKEEPIDELIMCDLCKYFQSHFNCDPPSGLVYGKYYCTFCRRTFIKHLKHK